MVWLLAIAILGAFVIWAVWPRKGFTESQRIDQLPPKFRELLNGTPKPRALILETGKDGPFVQFAHDSTLYANFPLVTERNRELESLFKEKISDHGLSIRREVGSDGAQFLEVDLPENSDQAATVAQLILIDVFGLDPSARIKAKLQL